MSELTEEPGKTFEVIITIERVCTVFVPDDILSTHESHEDAAEEIAMGGQSSWPKYCLDQDETWDVESITEIDADRKALAPAAQDGGGR